MENNEWLPCIKQLGNGANAQMTLAYSCFINGDHAGVIRHCNISKKLNPALYRPYLLLGWTYLNLGQLANALQEAEASLQIDESVIDAVLLAAIVLMELERDQEAIVKCHEGLRQCENYAFFYFLLGKLYNRQGDYEAATASLEKAVQISPQLTEARQLLASNYLHLKKDKKALNEIESVLQANPLSARMRLMLGALYAEQGDYPSALLEYRGATTINPRMADAHYQAGVSYYHLKEYPMAILELRIALSLHPNYPEAQHLLGKVYFVYNRYKLAIEYLQSALRLKIKFPEAHCDLGDVFAANKQFPEAIDEYRKAAKFYNITCEDGEKHVIGNDLVRAIRAFRSTLQLSEDFEIPGLVDQRKIQTFYTGKNKRAQNRFNVQLAVDIRDENQKQRTAETVDISRQGLLVESEQAVHVGSLITIMLSVPGFEEQIPIIGSVVRVDGESAGSGKRRFGIKLADEQSEDTGWNELFSEFLIS